MLHNCTYCDYSTTVKPNLRRHIKNKHEHNKNEIENNRGPVTMSIGESVELQPTSVFVGDDTLKEPLTEIKEQSTQIEIKEQSTQIGLGSVVNSTTHIPIEKYNEDCNKVIRIAHGWKQQCAVKDNAIRVRDNFLTGNNSKLQDEFTKNRILIEQNRNIMEVNNQLVLEKEKLISDGNDKLGAMGEDMVNLIHKNKILRRKSKKKNISSKYEGSGYGNKFKTKKAPTSIFVGKDNAKAPTILKTGESGTIAPTTVYILNDRKTAYVRGENQLAGCGFDFSKISQRSKGIGGMLRGSK